MSKIDYVYDGLSAEISIPPELLPEFKHAMFRAFNTWQDPSPEILDFYRTLMKNESIESILPKIKS